jgi:Ca-activated chloride channel family protein
VNVDYTEFSGNDARIMRRRSVTSFKHMVHGRKTVYGSRNGLRDYGIHDVAKQQPGIGFLMLVCAVFLLTRIVYADVGSNMRRGNHLERRGDYEAAIQHYEKALVQEPDNPKIHYNIGRALYRLEKYDEAISEFQLGFLEKEKDFQANVFYNIGNSQFKKGQLDAAIESYKMCLLMNHKDIEAKQNLEFCLRLKEQIQNQQQSDSTQQQQPPPQQQKQESKPQPKEGQISKDEAERILQAFGNEEKDNLERSRAREERKDVEKDW